MTLRLDIGIMLSTSALQAGKTSFLLVWLFEAFIPG